MTSKEAYYKVFPADRTDWPWTFTEEFDHGLVMYDTEVITPRPNQFAAIVEFVKRIGERGFWITDLEIWDKERVSEDNTFWFDVNGSYQEFNHIFWAVTEHALYSEHGTWGIYLTVDCFALFGSKREIAHIFQECYPEWRKDFADYASDLQLQYPHASIYDVIPKHLKVWEDLRN